MAITEAEAWLHQLPRLQKTGGQARIKQLLAALGNPEQQGQFVHVTGTNGKGSTANMVATMLEATGQTVGLFTSPFIMRFNERFMINHQPIDDATLAAGVAAIQAALAAVRRTQPDFTPTEFEAVTALGFWWFAAAAVDVAVIEVGIGGREDSTNVITPLVSVITTVGLDHAALLGDTIQSVAQHKAGIIKPQVPVVTGALLPEAQAVVAQVATATGSPWLAFERDFSVSQVQDLPWGQRFSYQSSEEVWRELSIPLIGRYQLSNAAIAIAAVAIVAKQLHLPVGLREVKAGLAAATWPGRLEKISDEPLIVLDGAHNPEGIAGLVATLAQRFGREPVTIIAGILHDKAVASMVAALAKQASPLVLVPVPDNPRATSLADYPDVSGGKEAASWQEALATHLQQHPEQPVVITGSLYLIAAVRQQLLS